MVYNSTGKHGMKKGVAARDGLNKKQQPPSVNGGKSEGSLLQ